MSQELIKASSVNDTSIAFMKAELDVAITTAQAFKRDINYFMQECIAIITRSDEIAASCIYALPRKMKNEKTGLYEQGFIRGKSIRLAEIILSNYENLTVASRIISVSPKTVTVEGLCWDLQKRTKYTAEVTENVNGTHGDAQKLAIGSATSKAVRNAIFKIVGPLADDLYRAAVAHAVGTQKTFPVIREKTFNRMKVLGISIEKILAFYGKESIEDFTPDLMEEITGIGTAIKNGDLKIDSVFIKNLPNDNANERLASLKTNAPAPTVNTETGEVTEPFNPDAGDKPEYEALKLQIQNAKNEDELFIAADLIVNIKDKVLNEDLHSLYKSRLAGFKK